jgi:hypothetical protein
VLQPEAIALYRACGYSDIEAFGPYRGSARSVCFGKTLNLASAVDQGAGPDYHNV